MKIETTLFRRVLKYIFLVIGTLVIGGLLFAGILGIYIVYEINNLFSNMNHKEKIISTPDKISANIEISEGTLTHVHIKVYDHENKFIENNATLMLNGVKMSLSKVPNGFYGYWTYYYIGSFDEPELFEKAKKFVFTLKRNNQEIHLATINTFPSVGKSNITYNKSKDGVEIFWKNLVIMNKLNISVSAIVEGQGKMAGYTVKSITINKSGSYKLLFKDLDGSISDIESVSFEFAGIQEKKVDSNLTENSKLIYNRKYDETIYLNK